jgi:hypothetical protein
MVKENVIKYFRDGGIFLFDESNQQSESAYYLVEDLMGEGEGQNITEVFLEDEQISLFYDSSIWNEKIVIEKYRKNEFVKSF